MDNLIADGALHEHEVRLLLFVLHWVLFPCVSTDETHGRVGQDGLEGKKQRSEDQVYVSNVYPLLEQFLSVINKAPF